MWYGRDFSTTLLVTGIEGTQFDYRDAAVQVTDLFVPLPGGHQAQNAALAIKASMIVLNGEHPEAVAAGLEAVRWRGRLEQVCGDPAIVVDGAHNPAAAAILATFLEEQCAGQAVILVLGVMADKDYQGIIDALAPVATQVIVTAPACRRAASPQDLAAAVRAAGFSAVRTAATVRDALATARDAYYELRKHRPALIVVTGSFYTAGEALEALGEPSTLSTLREWA
jgi:dihydrofolate synthase/folylpolyglutamate synthase